MTNPVVDLIGDRPAASCPSTRSRRRPASLSWDIAPVRSTRCCARAGEFAEPARPSAVRDRLDLVDRDRRLRTASTRPSRCARPPPPVAAWSFDELLRVQLALVLRKRELERTPRGIVHDVGDGSGGPLVERLPRAAALRAHRGPAAGDRRDRRPTWPSRHPMHRLLQGDVGSGKTVVAVSRAARRRAGRPPGRAHGPDRGARRAAPPRASGRCSTGFTVPDDDEAARWRRRATAAASRCSPTARPAAERRRLLAGLADGRRSTW